VTPVPGPSALSAALAASGLPTDAFEFRGFLPAKSGQRRTMIESLRGIQHTVAFYEAPHRIRESLRDVAELLGGVTPVVVARELTKIHEEFLRGSASQVLAVAEQRELKGEITLLIGKTDAADGTTQENLEERLKSLMREQHMDEKTALKALAKEQGCSKSELYRELQRIQASGHGKRK
jgi:16S rRNA (cytidine1402-2'-O)-methyltransferase